MPAAWEDTAAAGRSRFSPQYWGNQGCSGGWSCLPPLHARGSPCADSHRCPQISLVTPAESCSHRALVLVSGRWTGQADCGRDWWLDQGCVQRPVQPLEGTDAHSVCCGKQVPGPRPACWGGPGLLAPADPGDSRAAGSRTHVGDPRRSSRLLASVGPSPGCLWVGGSEAAGGPGQCVRSALAGGRGHRQLPPPVPHRSSPLRNGSRARRTTTLMTW